MPRWMVNMEFGNLAPVDDGDRRVAEMLSALADLAAGASTHRTTLRVAVFVDEATPGRAAQLAIARVMKARTAAGLGRSVPIHTDVDLLDAMDPVAVGSLLPAVVGVAELAHFLNLSRQRVWELGKAGVLPAPAETLASGPVWTRASIATFLARWRRTPGRPRRMTEWQFRIHVRDLEGRQFDDEGKRRAFLLSLGEYSAHLGITAHDHAVLEVGFTVEAEDLLTAVRIARELYIEAMGAASFHTRRLTIEKATVNERWLDLADFIGETEAKAQSRHP